MSSHYGVFSLECRVVILQGIFVTSQGVVLTLPGVIVTLRGIVVILQGIFVTLQGVGEPPLLLAASVYMAVRDAIKSVRREQAFREDFQLNVPASPKRVLHACTEE